MAHLWKGSIAANTQFWKQTFGLLLYALSTLAFAFPSTAQLQTDADIAIQRLYQQPALIPQQPLASRLSVIAAQFLGQPYALGALGEGISGEFDQYPLYRMDAFDCETYVDTVLALTFGHDLQSFQHYIRQIRYDKGQVAFIKRNHFISMDWNPHQQQQGFIQDITEETLASVQSPKALTALAYIDKPNWYQHVAAQRVRLYHTDTRETNRRIAKLQTQGATCASGYAHIPYIPFDVLFDSHGNANKALFAHIPSATILEIVRPNWDLTQVIGTHLNVSHLGFVVRENNQLFFLQASSSTQHVSKTPLIAYLRAAQKSQTIRGINLHKVLPQ